MNYREQNIWPLCTDGKDPERATMLSIITAKSCARIHLDDIEYIEQNGRKIEVITGDLKYCVYDNINNLEPYFNPGIFFRAMRSVIVNFDKIRNIEEDTIYFESGNTISMGRNNMCKTRNAFKKYLKQYFLNTSSYYKTDNRVMVAESNSIV